MLVLCVDHVSVVAGPWRQPCGSSTVSTTSGPWGRPMSRRIDSSRPSLSLSLSLSRVGLSTADFGRVRRPNGQTPVRPDAHTTKSLAACTQPRPGSRSGLRSGSGSKVNVKVGVSVKVRDGVMVRASVKGQGQDEDRGRGQGCPLVAPPSSRSPVFGFARTGPKLILSCSSTLASSARVQSEGTE